MKHFCQEGFFIFANSADLDEMPHNVAFHLGLQCLPKYIYLFTCIQNEKELNNG